MESDNAVSIPPARRPRRRHKFPKFTLPRQAEIWEYYEWGGKRKTLSKMLPRFDDYWVVDRATEDHMTVIAKQVDNNRNLVGRGLLHNLYMFPCQSDDEFTYAIIERLLGLGVDPDPVAVDGITPLFRAAERNPGAFNFAQLLTHCRPNLPMEIMFIVMDSVTHIRDDADEEVRAFRDARMDYWVKTTSLEVAKTVARLACEKKWFAVKNLCRRRVVSEEEKLAKHEGRDAIEWAEVHGEAMMANELRYLLKPMGSAGATTSPDAHVGATSSTSSVPVEDKSTSNNIRQQNQQSDAGEPSQQDSGATSKKRQRKE